MFIYPPTYLHPVFLVYVKHLIHAIPTLCVDGDVGGPLVVLRQMCHVTVQLALVLFRVGDGIDLCPSNDATGDGKNGTRVHEVRVDLSGGLTTLVDSPGFKCQWWDGHTSM